MASKSTSLSETVLRSVEIDVVYLAASLRHCNYESKHFSYTTR